MVTLGEARAELSRLLSYELNLGEYNNPSSLNDAINRAYQFVCYQAESPILTWEYTYNASDIKEGTRLPLGAWGVRTIYRIWWISGTTVIDLKESYMQRPLVHEEFNTASQRVIPSPLNETLMVYPPIRWLPENIGTGNPRSYGYIDGQLFFDSHPSTGTGFKIRLIGSFYPVPNATPAPPVPLLAADNDRFAISANLVEAVVLNAASIWVRPYPDLIPLSQEWALMADRIVALHRQVTEQNMLARSPGAVIETVMTPSIAQAVQKTAGGGSSSRRR